MKKNVSDEVVFDFIRNVPPTGCCGWECGWREIGGREPRGAVCQAGGGPDPGAWSLRKAPGSGCVADAGVKGEHEQRKLPAWHTAGVRVAGRARGAVTGCVVRRWNHGGPSPTRHEEASVPQWWSRGTESAGCRTARPGAWGEVRTPLGGRRVAG